ncbi:MAG: site-specific DNA-methyltransferase [Mesorhizobium sp.]|uniref:site-specific DNA-methyltransferase n=1 Tax=Mesorhizobium sp. TaxID=1871066 RepID=UPI0011F5505C|nr:site-specific DNA-methyltransferase [Mesorhizobium sp.]TIR16170.1 MAG: site-specific DNA-methyltransferase [Mesorhizobium sp.]
MQNQLWFGDNLAILREEIADESVDLVYLDPPFNSQANYNVLFKTPDEDAASAQVEAFRDTWTWGPEAKWAFDEIMHTGGSVASIIHALHAALGDSDMMAYLVMMAQRLHELRRVLKPTGSLYLHCDPTASHYLKILLDAIFGPANFLNEVIWKRTSAHSSARRYGPIHDSLLFYAKGEPHLWNPQFQPYTEEYLGLFFDQVDENGRRWKRSDLTGAGTRNGETGQPWRGIDITAKGRHWAYPPSHLEELDRAGKVHWPKKPDGMPRLRQYPEDLPGVAMQDIWTDLKPLHNRAAERLHYPTQKPVALLSRILQCSSNPGQVVLDPFCGCGTTVAAAQAAGRHWIGIDVAYHAIRVIEDRLAEMLGKVEYSLGGIPRDYAAAARLAERDKYQFQWWANYLVGVQALKEIRKGPDRGIDGQMFFMNGPRGWGRVLTSVKGGQHVGAKDVREFKAVMERERAEMGLFICLREPTREMRSEAASFGFVDTAHGHLPRLQIVSIERWFAGERPVIPSLGHVSREFFRMAGKAEKAKKGRRPDPMAPEFPFSFAGDKKETVVHFNPATVPKEQEASLL